MAKPTVLRGSLMLLEIGDGGSPEQFDNPCGLSEKAFNRTWSVNDEIIPDCDDPDAPAWNARTKVAAGATISGSGLLAKEFLDAYEAWFADQDARNCKITLDYDDGPIEYTGAFHLTTFNITGTIGQKVQVEIEAQSDGEVDYDASPS